MCIRDSDRTASCTELSEMVQGWRFYTNSMGKIGKTDTGGFFNETSVSYTHLDGFTTILTFEGGTEVLVEVGTNNDISLPRWYVRGEDGTAVIRDWQLNGEIIRKTGITEEKVVPRCV